VAHPVLEALLIVQWQAASGAPAEALAGAARLPPGALDLLARGPRLALAAAALRHDQDALAARLLAAGDGLPAAASVTRFVRGGPPDAELHWLEVMDPPAHRALRAAVEAPLHPAAPAAIEDGFVILRREPGAAPR